MKQLFSAQGRINRGKYFGFSFITSIVSGISSIPTENVALLVLGLAVTLVMLYANICLTIKRFHDLGRKGTHCFFILVPFYNIYLAFILFFKKGEENSNQYGDNPLKQAA